MFIFIYLTIVVLGILISILLHAIDVIDEDSMGSSMAFSLLWPIIIPVFIIIFSFFGFYLLCVKYKHKIRKILRIKDKNNIQEAHP